DPPLRPADPPRARPLRQMRQDVTAGRGTAQRVQIGEAQHERGGHHRRHVADEHAGQGPPPPQQRGRGTGRRDVRRQLERVDLVEDRALPVEPSRHGGLTRRGRAGPSGAHGRREARGKATEQTPAGDRTSLLAYVMGTSQTAPTCLPDMTTTDAPGLTYSSAPGRWVVVVTVLGSGIAALDATVVNIALPTIGREFHTGVGDVRWVITSYTLTVAAFLLIGGSLGDRFGRRKVYTIGIVWFAVASAACGLAPGPVFLIVTRALQGVGAALLTPGSLAILEASFVPADRSRAIGAWSGLSGVATAAGPLLGGFLISAASWRWIFFINVPVAIVVVAMAARHVPESRDPSVTGRIDYAGALAGVVF